MCNRCRRDYRLLSAPLRGLNFKYIIDDVNVTSSI